MSPRANVCWTCLARPLPPLQSADVLLNAMRLARRSALALGAASLALTADVGPARAADPIRLGLLRG